MIGLRAMSRRLHASDRLLSVVLYYWVSGFLGFGVYVG